LLSVDPGAFVSSFLSARERESPLSFKKISHWGVDQSEHLLFWSSSFKKLQSIWSKHAALNAKAPDITARSFFLFLIEEREALRTSRVRHSRRTLF
jgi:hypothetical protein